MRQGVEAPQGAVQPPCRPVPARQQGQDRRRQRAHTLDLGRREDGSGRAIIETNPPSDDRATATRTTSEWFSAYYERTAFTK